MTIPFASIVEGPRARNAKKYGDLKPLMESLESLGTIQPIVLSRRSVDPVDGRLKIQDAQNPQYDLVAGGRRYQALKKLKVETLFHGSTLTPGRYGFVFADEVAEHTRKEAELDENLHRLEMDWIDSALLVADIHDAKRRNAQAEGGRWGQRQTAALLGKGYGKSNVNIALIVAKLLRSGDTEIMACETLTHASQVILKRNEDKALAELQKRTLPKSSAPVMSRPADFTGTESFLDTLNTTLGKKGGDMPCPVTTKKVDDSTPSQSLAATKVQPSVAAEKVVVPLSEMFLNMDFRKTEALSSFCPTFDHIVTDIPYGIDMANLDPKQVASVAKEHDVEENIALFPEFLEFAWRSIKPGGFCVFFCDVIHWTTLHNIADAKGFRVQRWPIIACKTSPCQNSSAEFNLTKNFEVAMILRKDERSILRHDPKHAFNNGCWKAYNFRAEQDLYSNPFAKPFELWKDIYDMIALPGQSVLDPFCGEMSACRAAANCGLVPYGIEINPTHYNRGLEHMKAVYALIHKSNVEFV